MNNSEKDIKPIVEDLFVERMANLILSGELKVGEKLPSAREYADKIKVSKTIIRSGMEKLAQMGLIYIKPYDGSYVADYMFTGNLETVDVIVKYCGNDIDSDNFNSIIDISIAIENVAIRQFSKKHTYKDITELNSMIDEIKIYAIYNRLDYPRIAERLFNFFKSFCIRSQNPMLILIINSIQEICIKFLKTYVEKNKISEILNFLYQLVFLLEKGEEEKACRLMEFEIDKQKKKIE